MMTNAPTYQIDNTFILRNHCFAVSEIARLDLRFPVARNAFGGYDYAPRWMVDTFMWDTDHWVKYCHAPFETRAKADAYIAERRAD